MHTVMLPIFLTYFLYSFIYLIQLHLQTDNQNNTFKNKQRKTLIYKSDICIIRALYTEHEDSLFIK